MLMVGSSLQQCTILTITPHHKILTLIQTLTLNNRLYIFLDIDGVLATTAQYYTNRKKWHEMYDCYRFDEKCVKTFLEVLGKAATLGDYEPIIILSSDWKDRYSIDIMNQIFKWNGINTWEISDYTTSAWGTVFTSVQQLEECRAHEINQYVKNNDDVHYWLAIDDLDLSPWIEDEHFIHTPRANEGIKQSGIKDKILNKILCHSKNS